MFKGIYKDGKKYTGIGKHYSGNIAFSFKNGEGKKHHLHNYETLEEFIDKSKDPNRNKIITKFNDKFYDEFNKVIDKKTE